MVAVRRASGKLRNLEDVLRAESGGRTLRHRPHPLGHARTSHRGKRASSPRLPGDIVVVHNGIVENYLQLKRELTAEGHKFVTETDTEVIAHLVEKYFEGNLENAVRQAVTQADGRVRAERDLRERSEQDRRGEIRAAGGGRDWATANISWHRTFRRFSAIRAICSSLADGDVAVLTREGVHLTDFDGGP